MERWEWSHSEVVHDVLVSVEKPLVWVDPTAQITQEEHASEFLEDSGEEEETGD